MRRRGSMGPLALPEHRAQMTTTQHIEAAAAAAAADIPQEMEIEAHGRRIRLTDPVSAAVRELSDAQDRRIAVAALAGATGCAVTAATRLRAQADTVRTDAAEADLRRRGRLRRIARALDPDLEPPLPRRGIDAARETLWGAVRGVPLAPDLHGAVAAAACDGCGRVDGAVLVRHLAHGARCCHRGAWRPTGRPARPFARSFATAFENKGR